MALNTKAEMFPFTFTWRTSFSREAFHNLNCSDSSLILFWRWT